MLPTAPFVQTIVAPRNSGKTYLLINLLIQDKYYRNKFDKVYIISPTFYLDPKWDCISIPDKQIFTEFDEYSLESIIENKKIEEQILLILDDAIAEDGFKTSQILNKIAIRGRHMKVSMICISQKVCSISTTIRSQTDSMIVFKSRSSNEVESLYKDNNIGGLTRNGFNRLLFDCTEERYSFLNMNYQNNKVYKKFSEVSLKDYNND